MGSETKKRKGEGNMKDEKVGRGKEREEEAIKKGKEIKWRRGGG